MHSYKETLDFLYGLQNRGMKFGLRNIKALLAAVGNPERMFPSIHIAGTNGKGSTAAYLASVFTESGYKTALYTSPHLIDFTERIRINGEQLPEERLVEYARTLRPAIERLRATFFEATTCIALHYFADEECDIAVVEAGLGGRLDSTNVITPLVSVITTVSFDHMEYLGNTLRSITREKGGIIKKGVPCVTGSDVPEVIDTLRRICKRKNAQFFISSHYVSLTSVRSTKLHPVLRLQSQNLSIGKVCLGLAGVHQIRNAATAFAALDILLRRNSNRKRYARITLSSIRRGFERVRENTGLRGRLERVSGCFILDVAHNVEGLRSLLDSLRSQHVGRLVAVFGVMADKEYKEMCRIIAPMCTQVIAVQAGNRRALCSSEVVKEISALGTFVRDGKSVRRGMEMALKVAGKRQQIIVTGSHYVVGEALNWLRQRQSG